MNPYRTVEELEKEVVLDYARVRDTVEALETTGFMLEKVLESANETLGDLKQAQGTAVKLEGECEQLNGRAIAAESSEEILYKKIDELEKKLDKFEQKEFEAERAPRPTGFLNRFLDYVFRHVQN